MRLFPKTWLCLLLTLFISVHSVQAQKKSIEFNQLFDGTFVQNSVDSPEWMNNGPYFTSLEYNSKSGFVELRKYNITDNSYEVLVNEEELSNRNKGQKVEFQNYSFSSDENQILIATNIEAVWRRSRLADHLVFNLKTRKLIKIGLNEGKTSNAAFSPDGWKVGFTRNNDLYYHDLKSGKEIRITRDGEANNIINGSTDWVYEEEFSFAKAWFWSPDNKRIAFYRFDESGVNQFTFQMYSGLYPENITYKYPKAGEVNSKVKIGVFNLLTQQTGWMDIGKNEDQYVVRVNWTQDLGQLAIRRMSRLQNVQDLLLADVKTGESKLIKREESSTWIDENDDLRFLSNGKEFLYVSEESGYNHIWHYSKDGKLIRQVTIGKWDVTEIVGVNEKNEEIYYLSTEDSPLERHLYKINFNGKKKKRLTNESGVHRISMNNDQTWYLDYHSNVNRSLTVTLNQINNSKKTVLEDNEHLNKTISEYNWTNRELITIPVSNDLTLNAYLIKPPDFDPNKTYPLLVHVYGGPGSQLVRNEFSTSRREMWHKYLATSGYVVMAVDNRGTGSRGADFKKTVYKRLGWFEVIDQIAAASYLQKMPWIDNDRIGIWGWSYGGYMSALCLAKGGEIFKMAISVAPVTDWRFYDTIYTERYMQTPQLNPIGYEEGSVLTYSNHIRGNLLLIHGTADDNVHFQNSIALVESLQTNDIQFKTMYYPDRNHGIYAGNAQRHLYTLMTEYIFENL